jgi:hypothetical protein
VSFLAVFINSRQSVLSPLISFFSSSPIEQKYSL